MKNRILFVDDEPHVLEGLRRMLRAERARWDMRFVDGADAALDAARATDFDAVVSDVDMPGRDGFALLAELRAGRRTRDLPFIILTGRNERDIKRRALNLGATDLLNKPVDPEDLIARLRSMIRLKVCQDELRNRNEHLEKLVEERTAELAESRMDILWRLGKAAEYRDEATGNHVVRVACYCRAIARAFGADREFIEVLMLTSPLHDVGKIGIPDAILRKRGALDADEWDVMKRHCQIGAQILREDPKAMNTFLAWTEDGPHRRHGTGGDAVLRMAASIALTHHEWWDGSGYPAGLVGEEIPLESRIVALADVYDALRSERPYKPAFSEDKTIGIIQGEAGTHFDPAVCAAFLEATAELRQIREALHDGVADPRPMGCVT